MVYTLPRLIRKSPQREGGSSCDGGGGGDGDLDTLDGNGALAIELIGIARMALLLAVLQTLALVVLEHAVLAAVVTGTEATVADNGLGAILAVLEGAADLLGRHATAQGKGEVQG